MRVRLVKQFLLLGIFAIGAVSVSGQSINDAIQAYNNAATNYKQDPEKALQDIQLALQIADQLGEEGAETKQKCEELIPTIYFNLAMAKYRAKDLQATLDNLEKAEETAIKYNDGAVKSRVEKTMPKLYNALANNLFKENKFEEAITNYGKAIKLDPYFIDPYLGTALAYEGLKNEEKMVEFLDLTIDLGSKANDATNVEKAKTKGKAYFLKKADEARNANKLNEVVKLLESALKYDGDDYDIYRLMTINYSKLERWNDAIEYGNKALELVKGTAEDKAELYFLIAGAYQKLNKISDACAAYKNAAFGTFKPNADYQLQQLKCQ
jgi:tetratricopeptide (TPR) repeat protein